MAPFPQTSATSSTATPDPHASSVLPGLKRGIAVGVASSVCLILVALLAFFVLRRRKQRKAQQQQGRSPSVKELPAWPDGNFPSTPINSEKNWIALPSSPVEVDAHPTIYEMDAGQIRQIPELPTKIHISGASELETGQAKNESDELQRQSLTTKEDVGYRYSDVPTLHISPPEMSPLNSSSLLGLSPLSVSPLEEAYLPQSPCSPRSPQHWI